MMLHVLPTLDFSADPQKTTACFLSRAVGAVNHTTYSHNVKGVSQRVFYALSKDLHDAYSKKIATLKAVNSAYTWVA